MTQKNKTYLFQYKTVASSGNRAHQREILRLETVILGNHFIHLLFINTS